MNAMDVQDCAVTIVRFPNYRAFDGNDKNDEYDEVSREHSYATRPCMVDSEFITRQKCKLSVEFPLAKVNLIVCSESEDEISEEIITDTDFYAPGVVIESSDVVVGGYSEDSSLGMLARFFFGKK